MKAMQDLECSGMSLITAAEWSASSRRDALSLCAKAMGYARIGKSRYMGEPARSVKAHMTIA